MEPRLGDLYEQTTGCCLYLEVVEHPAGGYGLYSFLQNRRCPPHSFDLRPPGTYKYLGNGIEDPQLREHLKRIMQVGDWMHRNLKHEIPATLEYSRAFKEWQRLVMEENRKWPVALQKKIV